MHAQVEKPKENKSKAVTNFDGQKKINGKQGFGFVDNRYSRTPTQMCLQMAFDKSSQKPPRISEFVIINSISMLRLLTDISTVWVPGILKSASELVTELEDPTPEEKEEAENQKNVVKGLIKELHDVFVKNIRDAINDDLDKGKKSVLVSVKRQSKPPQKLTDTPEPAMVDEEDDGELTGSQSLRMEAGASEQEARKLSVAKRAPKPIKWQEFKDSLQPLYEEMQIIYEFMVELYASPGGFSAVGRAASTTNLMGADTNKSLFFMDTLLSGEAFDVKHKAANNHSRQVPVVADPLGSSERQKSIEGIEKAIGDKLTEQKQSFPIKKRDRGDGQAKAMGGWSAAEYAKAVDPKNEAASWEWLHLKAASLGGETNGKNLTAGTRDANTHMMPFESNVIALYKLKQGNKIKSLEANMKPGEKCTINGTTYKADHMVSEIIFEWKVTLNNGATQDSRVIFKPANPQPIITKDEVREIQNALKNQRDAIK